MTMMIEIYINKCYLVQLVGKKTHCTETQFLDDGGHHDGVAIMVIIF